MSIQSIETKPIVHVIYAENTSRNLNLIPDETYPVCDECEAKLEFE